MDGYSKYLLMVGAFVTLFTICLFFVMYNTANPNGKWPPEEQNCPDYWTEIYDATQNDITCYDTMRMSPDDDNGIIFNPKSVGVTYADKYSYDLTGYGGGAYDDDAGNGDASYDSSGAAAYAAGVVTGDGWSNNNTGATDAVTAGVVIDYYPSMFTGGTLPWGGIPSNCGNITGSTSNQFYARVPDGISQTSFGSTGAWSTHCGRKKWALENGIAWDGVSNSNVDCSNYLGGGNPDDVYSNSINNLSAS